MNRYYMPAFIAMASGSKHYPDIIAAIEKVSCSAFLTHRDPDNLSYGQDPTPPILDLSSLDLGFQIEILEVPEELHAEHNDDDDGPGRSEDYSVDTDKADQNSDLPENQFNA
jgi:hypothetical protein